MKINILLTLCLALTLTCAQANTTYSSTNTNLEIVDKPITITFWVGGVCGQCKARIEKALDIQGVRLAEYNLDKHECTVVYNPKKTTEEVIHKTLQDAGHDTSLGMASDEAYNSLNTCCQYRTAEHNH